MANTKSAILKKKIGNIIYDLMVKTSAKMVYVDDNKTLAQQLETTLEDVKDSQEKLAALIGTGDAKNITSSIDSAVRKAVDELNDENDEKSLAGRIVILQTTIDTITDADTGVIAIAENYTDEKLGLSGTAFDTVKSYVDNVKKDLNASIAGAFHFKGIVNYVDLIPTENISSGDVYQVVYAGKSADKGTTLLNAEYAYDGTEFRELGSIIDLSNYYTIDQTVTAINTAEKNAKSYTDTEISKVNATVATKARLVVSQTKPSDLTESDLWAKVIS
jgi:hypothetical protein